MLHKGKYYRLKTYEEIRKTENVRIEFHSDGNWIAYLGTTGYNYSRKMISRVREQYNNKLLCENIIDYKGEVPKFYKEGFYFQEWMLMPINTLMETE